MAAVKVNTEPLPAPAARRGGKGKLRMTRDAAPEARRSVAEGFAAVLAPAAGAAGDVVRRQGGFAPLGAPAKVAAAAGADFGTQEGFPGMTDAVAEAEPEEVRGLVHEDAGELGSRAVEGDAALAEEGAGMYRTPAVAEVGCGLDADGRAGERGHAG